MRNVARPAPISEHRLSRLMRWALLWLMRAAALVLGAHGRADVRERVQASLYDMRRRVLAMLLVRASARVGHVYGDPVLAAWLKPRRGRTSAFRMVAGAAARRALRGYGRGRGLLREIGALMQALARPGALISHLAKRVKRGMSRALSATFDENIASAWVKRCGGAALALAPGFADTS